MQINTVLITRGNQRDETIFTQGHHSKRKCKPKAVYKQSTVCNPDNLQINVWTVNKKCGVPCGYIGADHRN